MPQVARLVFCIALSVLSLVLFRQGMAQPLNQQFVFEQNFRERIAACRQDFSLPEVHYLPMGVGEVTVTSCFNNGFNTLKPHTERVGSCLIAAKSETIIERGNIAYDQVCLEKHIGKPDKCKIDCKDSPQGLKNKPECTPGKIRIIRRKYHCRFKGAGAILGKTGEVRMSGEKVFFRGEEPSNFETEDPGCEQIFNKLFTKQNKYGYLE